MPETMPPSIPSITADFDIAATDLTEPVLEHDIPSVEEYPVGFCRPPVEHRFQKGRSGNPRGRPKGRRNARKILEEALFKPVPVQCGDRERRIPVIEAIAQTHFLKAAKGDWNSAKLAFNVAEKMGLFDEVADQNVIPTELDHASEQAGCIFELIDRRAISDEEVEELSRFAEIIHLGGDFTALSDANYSRLRQITNKGRGKDITLQ